MAIPDNTMKYVISGTLAGGAEQFATSFFVGPVSNPAGTTDANLTIELGSATWTALFSAMKAVMSPSSAVVAVDQYYILGGVAIAHAHSTTGAGVGTGGTPGLPPQCAIVMTLRTALASRHGRGRMYFPYTSGTTATNGLGSSAAINALVDALANHFSDVATGPADAVVVSQTLGAINPIVSVDADLVLDTQRRRRNKLTSTRHSHSAL